LENLQTQGISLPRLGLGTFRMQGDICRAAVESALGLGYRHIDTAEMYANEDAIGAAIASSGVARGDLHIPPKSGTKIWRRTQSAKRSTPASRSYGSIMSISIWCTGRPRK
jgi:2,5-diketo-D-gluconate reductase B